MGISVTMGATIQCSFGMAPSTLVAIPNARVFIEGKPAADINTTITGANIPPFGMCTSLANPTVAAATAAALGVLTPMPCVPLVAGAWVPPAAQTTIGGKPALAMPAQCMCAWGGVIVISNPGATRTTAK